MNSTSGKGNSPFLLRLLRRGVSRVSKTHLLGVRWAQVDLEWPFCPPINLGFVSGFQLWVLTFWVLDSRLHQFGLEVLLHGHVNGPWDYLRGAPFGHPYELVQPKLVGRACWLYGSNLNLVQVLPSYS